MKQLLMITCCAAFFSCNKPSHNMPEKIRVMGEGKVRVQPDKVIMTLNVSFTEPRMADAVRKTQETLDSVLLILGNFASNKTDIKTSSISANKEYRYNGRTEEFVGFVANQSIDFSLNNIDKFTELTGRILETKISSISNIQFGHSMADSLFREADLLAYDDALKSANKLCNRADVKLGKLIFITNTSDNNEYEYNTHGGRETINTYSKAYGGRGFKISPEVLEFRRTIISEYGIAN